MFLVLSLQQFGKILDVEIIFNERGSKVSPVSVSHSASPKTCFIGAGRRIRSHAAQVYQCLPWVRVSRKRLLTVRETREECSSSKDRRQGSSASLGCLKRGNKSAWEINA